jgi:CRP-like cAMP-binding protein/ActR/RegA family two-component response regulator
MTKNVLIIEDSDDVRENMKEILELSSYKVHSACNGKEGLEMAQKNSPDIILCDVMMPELDGYGVLRGLSNNPKTKNIPFIFVTAKSEKQDFRTGMDLGADDYLTKPFNGNDLLSLVSARLKKAEVLNGLLKNNFNDLEEFLLDPDISIENIYNISDKIVPKKIKKKEILFVEGDSAKYLYFLVSGKIKTFRTNEQGKEYITQVHKEKDFFGYSSLLESNTYQDTAVAIEDSEVASITKQDFYQLLLSNNELYTKFIKFITSDLTETHEKLIKLAYDSARKRVAESILYLAKKYHPTLSNNISFSVCRDDISSISGVSPESVSRNLTDLRSEKLIELQNGQIKILDVKKLSSLKN